MMRYILLDLLTIGLVTVFIVSGKPVTKAYKTAFFNYHFQTLNGKSISKSAAKTGSNRIRLYSKHLGTYVRITNTTISALTASKLDPATSILIEPYYDKYSSIYDSTVNVTIRSNHGFYVCFDKRSAVVIKKSFIIKYCLFNEKLYKSGDWVTFRSAHNNTWYLGFSGKNKKNHTRGLPKLGRKTDSRRRSVKFIKTRIE